MKKLGEILRETRVSKHITQQQVAKHLLLKPEVVQAIEEGDWQSLPEAAYVKGFIKSYAQYLGLDENRLLALHRAEYDERKYITPKPPKKRRLMFTPNLIAPITFFTAVVIFISYLALQYTSVLSSPRLEIFTPQDDITTPVSIIEISGKTEKETTVSIEGDLIPIDQDGNFTYQVRLEEGQNVIEIIASKRLSPKTKITRTVRLSR